MGELNHAILRLKTASTYVIWRFLSTRSTRLQYTVGEFSRRSYILPASIEAITVCSRHESYHPVRRLVSDHYGRLPGDSVEGYGLGSCLIVTGKR